MSSNETPSPSDAIRPWLREWVRDVYYAKRGEIEPLIKALRSNRPLGFDPRVEKYVRDTLAGLLAGEFKRSRGRTKLSNGNIACRQLDQAYLIIDIDRLHRRMIVNGARNPQQEACNQYAKERGSITGKSVLRHYRKAKSNPAVRALLRGVPSQEEGLSPGGAPLADLGKRYAKTGNGEFK